jgi:glycosyltransferase involved in cell wall biosynthesis
MLVFITGKSPLQRRGGLETYVRAHALAGARAGFDVHVFCVWHRSRQIRAGWGVVHHVGTPVRPFSSSMATLHARFMRRAVVRHVRGAAPQGPVIVHSFGAWAVVGAAVADTLAGGGIAAAPVASAYTTLVHEHRGIIQGLRREHGWFNVARYWTRYLWARAVADRAEHRGYARSRRVLINYESVRVLLLDSYGSHLDVRRIPYASDLAFEPESTRPPVPAHLAHLRPSAGPLVLSVSRHDPRKGVDVLIHALAALARAGVPFRACLVGAGSTLEANRLLASRLGLDGQVAITGRVASVRPYLAHADVFVLPSLEEGSGSLSLLEALQYGLPIVASRCDGIPEDVRPDAAEGGAGDAALLVGPGDRQELAAALARLLTDPSLRSRLGDAALDTYEQRFSARAFTGALRETYAELGADAG